MSQTNSYSTPRVANSTIQEELPFTSPRQRMDAIVSQNFEPPSDEVDSALTILESGTPHILLAKDDTGKFIFYDAILQCNRDCQFTLTVRNEIDYGTNKTIVHRDPIHHEWKLQQLLGFSLENEASELIMEFAQQDDSINPLALAFQFNLESEHPATLSLTNMTGLYNGELSLIARNESITTSWVLGLSEIAESCELHLCGDDEQIPMNDTMSNVQHAMNDVNLNTPVKGDLHDLPSLPRPTVGPNSRMSMQFNSNRRMTRYSLAPTSGAGNRQSVVPGRHFGKSILPNANHDSNRAVSCELIRSIETSYEQKIAQLEEAHVKEKSTIRQQQKVEIHKFQATHQAELQTVEDNYRAQLQTINEGHINKINEINQQHAIVLQKELTALKTVHSGELSQVIAKSQTELREVLQSAESEYNNQLEDMKGQYESEIADIVEKHSNESEQLQDIITNLFHDKKKLINALIESQGNIRVFVRVRPILPHEIQQAKDSGIAHSSCIDVVNQLDMFNSAYGNGKDRNEDKLKSVKNSKSDISTLLADQLGAYKVTVTDSDKHTPTTNDYLFEHVFDHESSQSDVVTQVLPFVTSVADGYNVCIFAYGQTGSGKTFTMEGTDAQMGVNYTALHALFNTLAERQEQLDKTGVELKFGVEISAVEIYNEIVRDLFTADQVNISYVNNKATFQNMSSREVFSCDQIRHELRTKAYPNRTVAATNMNATSSRSHSLIFVNIKSIYTDLDQPTQQEIVQSRLVLVDLAGSERVQRSGVQGQAFIEATNINKSLSNLGLCLAQLQQGEKHIQFRDSKLTMALADCLTGESKVLMFANVSPANINASETNSTLQFALRAQKTGLGKAVKNTTATGAITAQSSAIPGRATVSGGKTRVEDDKFKNLEKELAGLKSQRDQLQSELSQAKYAVKANENVIADQKDKIQSLEAVVKKKETQVQQAQAQNRQSIAVPKSFPGINKRATINGVRSKLTIAAAMNGGASETIEEMHEDDGENNHNNVVANSAEDHNDQLVQLDPISSLPSPVMSSGLSDKSSSSNSKRRSQDPTDPAQIKSERIPTHLNKQPRIAVASSAVSSSVPRTAPTSAAPTATSRPTISSKSALTSQLSRTTVTGTRAPLSSTSSSTINRPTISNTVSRAPTSAATATTIKRPLTTASATARPTISATSAVASTPIRKTVVGMPPASATKKPTAK